MKILAAAGLVSLALYGTALAAQERCDGWSAELQSAEGRIEIRRANEAQWEPLAVGGRICLNDTVRALAYSRALIGLPGDTDVRVDELTTMTFQPPDDENRTVLDMIRGLIHIISRDPRDLKITTPFLNAGLEGTEFLVRLDDETFDVAVYEGVVALDNAAGRLDVPRGQEVQVRAGDLGAPLQKAAERADLAWSLYYPRVLAGPVPAADDPAGAAEPPAFFAGRAHSRMVLGRIDEAKADIGEALRLESEDPEALAVDAMIAFVGGDAAWAAAQVGRALDEDPRSSAALIAQTHLLVSRNELRQALAVADRLVGIDPGNALAHARRAEVLIALGDARGGRDAAATALTLDPTLGAGHIALGFAALADGEPDAAAGHFTEAIEVDSAASLARVGLALATYRSGASTDARNALELAVILDPGASILRSYVGAAYADEMRTRLAMTQLDMAKTLDREDPTPSLYNALLSENENRSVDALDELERAAAANDEQPVFRSRLTLEEDLATRSASQGRIYRSLGFEALAPPIASQALADDPGDYSAHSLLADVYSQQPRQEVARISEIYQAQLLQPLNVVPVLPQLAQVNLFISDTVGPAELRRADARSSFVSNGLNILTSGVAGSNGSSGENVVVAGLLDKVSFNLGQFRYETDGFRPNNDFDHQVASALVQYRPSGATSLQFELRSAETDRGDLMLLFDPTGYDPIGRNHVGSDVVRVGAMHRVSPFTTVLGSVMLEQVDQAYAAGSLTAIDAGVDTGIVEFQVVNELPGWNLLSGLRVTRSNRDLVTMLALPLPDPPYLLESTEFETSRQRHSQSYFYASHDIGDRLSLTAGASVDQVDGYEFNKTATSPKLGLTWRPGAATSVYVGLFKTMQGSVVSKQLIHPSLEPTQVAGFSQPIFGSEAEQATNYAARLDHRLADRLRFSIEHRERDVKTPYSFVTLPDPVLMHAMLHASESFGGANLFWTPLDRLAVTAGLQYEDFDYHGNGSPNRVSQLRTRRLPLQATVFVGSALNVRVAATAIRQDGLFEVNGPVQIFEPGSSAFAVVDASIGYRLPGRHGSVELGVRNLFDREFRFQDTDPENPRVFPERYTAVRVSVSF